VLDYDQLNDFFDSFKRSVFRLENLDTYTTAHEQDRVARYLAGEEFQPPADSSWNEQMAGRVAAGCQWAKVHVLRDPTSAYFRYAAEWSWPNSSAYGQDVRILDLVRRSQPDDVPDEDFWIIDDEVVVRMHYDNDGRWQGADLAPVDDLPRYVLAKKRAYEMAVPFEQWWAAHPEHHRGSWLGH
jgi:hypothetical protein